MNHETKSAESADLDPLLLLVMLGMAPHDLFKLVHCVTAIVSPEILRWVSGLSFIGMAVWTMIPDKIEEEKTRVAKKFGVFGTTLITFFLAEMGDKTQIATVAMAAHYGAPLMVVLGTRSGC